MAKDNDKLVREKLVARGAAALTDSELLSVVLDGGSSGGGRSSGAATGPSAGPGSGTSFGASFGSEPLEAAAAALEGNTLSSLSQMPLRDLRMAGGLGIRRAATLAAAFELGRRVRAEEAVDIATVDSSEDVRRMFQPMLSALRHEEFWVVYLNSAHRILEKARISQGGVNGTVVDHKLIVKRAVELLATAIVVVHNHPSGVAGPSKEDRDVTSRLATAASLFDIQLLDHLIMAGEKVFSFRSEGLIE